MDRLKNTGGDLMSGIRRPETPTVRPEDFLEDRILPITEADIDELGTRIVTLNDAKRCGLVIDDKAKVKMGGVDFPVCGIFDNKKNLIAVHLDPAHPERNSGFTWQVPDEFKKRLGDVSIEISGFVVDKEKNLVGIMMEDEFINLNSKVIYKRSEYEKIFHPEGKLDEPRTDYLHLKNKGFFTDEGKGQIEKDRKAIALKTLMKDEDDRPDIKVQEEEGLFCKFRNKKLRNKFIEILQSVGYEHIKIENENSVLIRVGGALFNDMVKLMPQLEQEYKKRLEEVSSRIEAQRAQLLKDYVIPKVMKLDNQYLCDFKNETERNEFVNKLKQFGFTEGQSEAHDMRKDNSRMCVMIKGTLLKQVLALHHQLEEQKQRGASPPSAGGRSPG